MLRDRDKFNLSILLIASISIVLVASYSIGAEKNIDLNIFVAIVVAILISSYFLAKTKNNFLKQYIIILANKILSTKKLNLNTIENTKETQEKKERYFAYKHPFYYKLLLVFLVCLAVFTVIILIWVLTKYF